MNLSGVSRAFIAMSFAWGAAAVAQPNDAPYMVPGNEAYNREHPWEVHGGPYDNRWYRERAEDYRRHGYPGAGPARDLRIGQRLPRDWRQPHYAVEDWRGHRLLTPPAGYQWYQTGADYVLVDRSTGVIAQVLRQR